MPWPIFIEEAVVEPGIDACLCYLLLEGANTGPPMHGTGQGWALERHFWHVGRAEHPLDDADDACADDAVRTGILGMRRCHVDRQPGRARSVAGFSSMSPLRIAVTGRQKL